MWAVSLVQTQVDYVSHSRRIGRDLAGSVRGWETMKTAQIWILIGFFLTVSVVVIYRVITTERPSEALQAAQEALARDKIELERYRIGELESEKFMGWFNRIIWRRFRRLDA